MRKMVVFLLLPAGLAWVMLTFAIFWPGLKQLQRAYLMAVWIIYTLAGNPLLGNRLLHHLEKPYINHADPQEPFDVVFVLGGGTLLTLTGKPQLSTGGDRLMTAARLYRRGLVKKLVSSGRSITEVSGHRDLSAETMTIWKDLGIPPDAMIGFSSPRNTEEEIRVYKAYLDSLPEKPARVGICTSAWHLRRTEKLWLREGIDAVPVPADFRSHPIPFQGIYLIPRKRGFADIQVALWEFLALIAD